MSVKILDIKIDEITIANLLDNIFISLQGQDQKQIATINPEFIVEAQKDEDFKNILNSCSYNTADGTGVYLAAKFKSKKITRITGIDLIYSIINDQRINNYRIYLLGAREGVAYAAKKKLETLNPHLQIVGCNSGFTNIQEMNLIELNDIIDKINRARPDLLLVGYNAPMAQKFIDQYLASINTVKIAIGVGGSFDFIANPSLRAPRLFRYCGLEWLYRLYRQPWRYRRIITALIKFSYQFIVYDFFAKNNK